MADVASKQQTTALFLSNIVTRTRRHTELTKKNSDVMGNLCCPREHSVQQAPRDLIPLPMKQRGKRCVASDSSLLRAFVVGW